MPERFDICLWFVGSRSSRRRPFEVLPAAVPTLKTPVCVLKLQTETGLSSEAPWAEAASCLTDRIPEQELWRFTSVCSPRRAPP